MGLGKLLSTDSRRRGSGNTINAENPFTFPIVIGLYPITVVAETTRIVAKKVGQKG